MNVDVLTKKNVYTPEIPLGCFFLYEHNLAVTIPYRLDCIVLKLNRCFDTTICYTTCARISC